MTTLAKETLPTCMRSEFRVPVSLSARTVEVVAVYEQTSENFHWICLRCEGEVINIVLADGEWNVNDDGRSFGCTTRAARIRTAVGPVGVTVEVSSEADWQANIQLYTPGWEHTLTFQLDYDGWKWFDGWDGCSED